MFRIVAVSVCVVLLLTVRAGCDDAAAAKDSREDDRKAAVSSTSGSVRRTTTQSSANVTRDSQLLSVLAARRRQLLTGRLATHISTLASLAHKPHTGNTTYASLEVRDANSSTVKRITFDNGSNEAAPSLRLVATDGTKEIHRQDVKSHEIRHLFVPKIYQDNKRNRRKENKTEENATEREKTVIYVPPDKLEGEKDIDLEPDEEFQVDESNNGLYFLNYSDTENVTQNPELNQTKTSVPIIIEVTESSSVTPEATTPIIKISTEAVVTTTKSSDVSKEDKTESNVIANSTDTLSKSTKLLKIENDKDTNHTHFMSDELYNHFRPLESELPAEDMAPFIFFGQKIGGSVLSDNLTNSPSLSASTKSVNYIVSPTDKRKFTSRYSATEKYVNTSVNEDELNEEMDVSVVKNTIEKNKIRNTVKGPAPARHVGLVNAYRKYSITTHTPSPSNTSSIAQLNVTQPLIQIVVPKLNKTKDFSQNISEINQEVEKTIDTNSTASISRETIKTNGTVAPRNYTRTYHNVRRRPSRLTVSSPEIVAPTVSANTTTTEKAATSVYTAVVTSVSITSSVKGVNKTDAENGTIIDSIDVKNETIILPAVPILINSTDYTTTSTTAFPPSTARSYKHRIRIRTTTTESSLNQPISAHFKPTNSPLTSDAPVKSSSDLKSEATTSKISERLANLFRQQNENGNDNHTPNDGVIRPKNILKRRRPTTTTTATATTLPPVFTYGVTLPETTKSVTKPTTLSIPLQTTENIETTENIFEPFVVTSKTSSESSSKLYIVSNTNKNQENNTALNSTREDIEIPKTQNEEVVIEAEKTYTASYVLAGLGFLPVMAIIVFVMRNVLNKKTKELDTEYEGYFDDGEIKKESPITPVARPPMPTPSKPDQKWEFPRNKLRLQTLLGQGNFGQVWKAEADDLTGHDGLTRLVAVKTIKETASQKEKQELLHEIYIMQKIGTHPNVVTLLGCCSEQEPYLLIMEYVMCGKLLTYLRERRSRPDRFSGSGALTSRDLTVFAYCVARGMDYIASKGIVHRDLAARNVLVDHNKLCKIADFGMSRAAGSQARTARGALPVRWMAPEALLYNVYSHHTDVWAFGILLWEIVTLGSTPYASMSGREVLTAVTEGYRLERPPHCKPQLYRAMHSCWHADPSQRPTFASLKAQLAELLDNEPSEGNYVDLDSFYQESSVYSDPSAIIHDEDGLSAEYDRERRVFRELKKGPPRDKFESRPFNVRDEEFRNKFSIGVGTPRMGGFGIRDVPFNERNFSDGEFNERTFTDNNFSERNFNDTNFSDRNFADKNFADRNFSDKTFQFTDTNFTESKGGKLSTSSFHREKERENPLVSRNSFSGFPRVGRDSHFQMSPDGRNKRVPEFECDI